MPSPQRLYRKHYYQEMPPNSRCVHRPLSWGNQYVISRDGTREECLALFIAAHERDATYRALPAGTARKDLACLYPLDKACHVDVLLVWANEPD